jgi:hypothetical protein
VSVPAGLAAVPRPSASYPYSAPGNTLPSDLHDVSPAVAGPAGHIGGTDQRHPRVNNG